jgi:hypothetical protein
MIACRNQIPLWLLRRALRASAREGDPIFSSFTGPCAMTVTAKEPNRAFRGAELEEELVTELAARRVAALPDGNPLRGISEQFSSAPSS